MHRRLESPGMYSIIHLLDASFSLQVSSILSILLVFHPFPHHPPSPTLNIPLSPSLVIPPFPSIDIPPSHHKIYLPLPLSSHSPDVPSSNVLYIPPILSTVFLHLNTWHIYISSFLSFTRYSVLSLTRYSSLSFTKYSSLSCTRNGFLRQIFLPLQILANKRGLDTSAKPAIHTSSLSQWIILLKLVQNRFVFVYEYMYVCVWYTSRISELTISNSNSARVGVRGGLHQIEQTHANSSLQTLPNPTELSLLHTDDLNIFATHTHPYRHCECVLLQYIIWMVACVSVGAEINKAKRRLRFSGILYPLDDMSHG